MSTRFVTTTVVAEATLTPVLPSSDQPTPVVAIVGGVVGGALLAVLVTAGWIWWGKLIKRKQLADRLENESRIRTFRNTCHNISISQLPRPFTGHTDVPYQKIRFTNAHNLNGDALPTLTTGQMPLSRTRPDRNSAERTSMPHWSVSAKPSVNSFNSTYTTASEEMRSELVGDEAELYKETELSD